MFEIFLLKKKENRRNAQKNMERVSIIMKVMVVCFLVISIYKSFNEYSDHVLILIKHTTNVILEGAGYYRLTVS